MDLIIQANFYPTVRITRSYPFGLPSHTTHLLQPLDVCVFQPLKHWHSKAVNGCSSQYCYAWQQYLYHPQCTELDDVKQKILIGNRFKRCQFAVSSCCSRSSPLLTNGRPTAFERRLQASKSKQIEPKNEIQEKANESLTISDKRQRHHRKVFPYFVF